MTASLLENRVGKSPAVTVNSGSSSSSSGTASDGDASDQGLNSDEQREQFVTLAVGKQQTTIHEDRRGTIEDNTDSEGEGKNAFNDSFCTDISSEDSLLVGYASDESLTKEDRVLQNQIIANFAHTFKKGYNNKHQSFLMREKTRRGTSAFSPTGGNSDDESFFKKSKHPGQGVEEVIKECGTETESDELSDLDDDSDISSPMQAKDSLRKSRTYRPENKVVDYDDINL